MSPPVHGRLTRRRVEGTELQLRGDDVAARLEQLDLLLAESTTIVYRRSASAPYPLIYVSSNVEAVLGFRASDLVESTVSFHSQVLQADGPVLERALAHVGEDRMCVTYGLVDARGTLRWLQDEMRLVVDPGRRPAEIVGHLTDVTDRQALMEQLVRSEERHALAVQGAQAGLWELDVSSNRVFLSPRALELLGHADDEVGPYVELAFFLEHIHPEDRAEVQAALQEHLDGRGAFNIEYRGRSKSGSPQWFHACGQAIWVGDLWPARVAGWLSDVSQRRRLEEELRQAQKMEAIGRLAGGVAHDFNNLLSVILSCAEFVGMELPKEHLASEDVREIVLAAKRGAALTRQLLAFSRQQRTEPRVLDLNFALHDIERMLRRLIGEDIELTAVRSPEPQCIRIDPGQLEQVILNLVVNARDAMRDGGRLVLSTGRVAALPAEASVGARTILPGPYAVLRVRDTGHGMDGETCARIFEPFFTTKEKGKGTGLGLSTVYGIVTQSGGRIAVDSDVGFGTTFRVYLPLCEAPRMEVMAHETSGAHRVPSTGRTVLLAEDDDQLRSLLRRILEATGCKVIAARDGREAMTLAERTDGPINLLVSDIVMPGMSGPHLHTALRAQRASLRVLYISGHAGQHVLPPDDAPVLQKPFTSQLLAWRVRQMLDEGDGPAPIPLPRSVKDES